MRQGQPELDAYVRGPMPQGVELWRQILLGGACVPKLSGKELKQGKTLFPFRLPVSGGSGRGCRTAVGLRLLGETHRFRWRSLNFSAKPLGLLSIPFEPELLELLLPRS